MQRAKISASVSRFNDQVTISLDTGGTIYLNAKDAQTLAYALNECAYDIVNVPKYYNSHVPTMCWEFEGHK